MVAAGIRKSCLHKTNFFLYWAGIVNVLHQEYIVMDATAQTVLTILNTKWLDEKLLKPLWSVIQMHLGQKLQAALTEHAITGYYSV